MTKVQPIPSIILALLGLVISILDTGSSALVPTTERTGTEMALTGRALHFVLKVGNLRKNVEFFRDKLAMKVLRHEVFDEGCEAACNGPYSNKWSKTMIGYGPEDGNFVLELTYNYSVGSYQLGNDLQFIKITVKQKDLFDKLAVSAGEGLSVKQSGSIALKSPDGYPFLVSLDTSVSHDDVTEVCLSCKDLKSSTHYWSEVLNMRLVKESGNETLLRYAPGQAYLRLRELNEAIDHKTAYGRIAFSCPTESLTHVQAASEAAKQKILTPLLSLDTPGKATVKVVILADPDGHEICFVGDEGFRELSKVDPEADTLIEKSMAEDKSQEWFAKKGISKAHG